MNDIIKELKNTIDEKLHLQLEQNQQGWLIPDNNTNIQVRALHEHSIGFSLDVSDSQQKPLAFFSDSPPQDLAKMCDALIAIVDESELYLFVIEIKSAHKGDYRKQIANGWYFWRWLIALCKEHGYLPLKPEPLYIAVLIWKPREKQVRKGATTHRGNSGIQVAKKKSFDARFEIQNHNLIILRELIQRTS